MRSTVYRKQAKLNYGDPAVQLRINEACEAVRTGEIGNLSLAAHKFKIPYTTLRNRYHGFTQPTREAHEHQRLLDPAQEQVMVDWMRFLGFIGRPICRATVRPKMVELCGRLPGKTWVWRFVNRHPELKLRKGSGLDPKRAQAFNFPVVNDHFKKLQKVLTENEIPWENVYNMDEKGIQLGGGRKGTGCKYFYGADLELVTVIESCCADGTAFKPAFVFSGKSVDEENVEADDDICVATSENGWTSDSLCEQWFEKSFIPQAKARNMSGKPILLIFDGHGSHITNKMIELAVKNKIELFCLPPHTTHKLQPLDVGVFRPLQREWAKQCDLYLSTTGVSMQKKHVIREYMKARERSFSEDTILHAWKKSGIRPLDGVKVFTDADFMPSVNTSTDANIQVPGSYPREFPSDFEIPDDAEMDDGEAEEEGAMDEDDNEDEEELDYEAFSKAWADGDWEDEEGDDGEEDGQEGLERDAFLAESLNMGGDDGGGSQQVSVESMDQNVPSPTRSHMPNSELRPTPSTHMPSTGSATGSATASATPTLSHSRRSSEDTKRLDDLIKPSSWNSRQALKDENSALKEELKRLRAQRNHAEAHSILAHRELATLKLQNSAKASGKKRRTGIRINAELLTSAEARARREADQVIKDAANKKKEEAKQRTAERALAEQARRLQMGAGYEFSGTLGSKKRGELKDIIKALGLSTTGTKAILHEAIQQHFDTHPDLKSDRRFVGLFTSRRRPPAPANQNEPPQQSPHLTHPTPAQPVAGPSRSHLQTVNSARYTPYPQPHYPLISPPRTEPLSDIPQNYYHYQFPVRYEMYPPPS